MIDEIIYRLMRLTILMMSYIPYPLAQFHGKGLGMLAYLIPISRKKVALENIKQSFTGITERQAKRLLRRVYMHFGRMFLEIPYIFRMTRDNLERYFVAEGEENILDALGRKKGVFFLTAHFGNWEFLCAAGSLYFGNLAVLARPADFAPLDRIIYELRSRFGTEVIPKQRAMRRLLGALKENKLVGILLDQNVDWYEGVYVPFLGRWACTNKGLALLALKTGTPVVPIFLVRQEDGRYRVIFEKEVELRRTGDKTKDVEDNTEIFTSVIEKYVRRYPDHWFWFHKRWKTKNYCEWNDGMMESWNAGSETRRQRA
jgi:KDO2-lipid IV(A) lauroyltransferase